MKHKEICPFLEELGFSDFLAVSVEVNSIEGCGFGGGATEGVFPPELELEPEEAEVEAVAVDLVIEAFSLP
ncbi:hypothetical protein WICPIJ_004115 [Wickerhamomyces pijperi]|uniref:Uncharacterized protein n=1 Tax=Wickerhamomyces pijperi TaxID=599730 RepID=A0A9P8TMC9_WICPI|nr:hypothetical protein WICPIJ_004115 [Wickerhamomyces pijperi]